MLDSGSVLFLFSVTSSEKVDKAQRYADFTLLSVPYPGMFLLSQHEVLTAFRNRVECSKVVQQEKAIIEIASLNPDDAPAIRGQELRVEGEVAYLLYIHRSAGVACLRGST